MFSVFYNIKGICFHYVFGLKPEASLLLLEYIGKCDSMIKYVKKRGINMEKTIQSFSRWLEIEKGYSDNTVSGYRRDLFEFATHIGEKSTVKSITAPQVQSFIASLHGKNSGATVARKLSALRTFFRFYYDRNRLKRIRLLE
jgi:hypothetical protein